MTGYEIMNKKAVLIAMNAHRAVSKWIEWSVA